MKYDTLITKQITVLKFSQANEIICSFQQTASPVLQVFSPTSFVIIRAEDQEKQLTKKLLSTGNSSKNPTLLPHQTFLRGDKAITAQWPSTQKMGEYDCSKLVLVNQQKTT